MANHLKMQKYHTYKPPSKKSPLYNHANNVARKQKETEEILTFLREELKLEKMEKKM